MTRAKSAFLAMLVVLLSPMTATAVPIAYDLEILSSEGSATGSFVGDDSDGNGVLTADEILSIMLTATGTAFTGGPITIDAAEAIVNLFTLDLTTLALTLLDVSNGLGPFDGRESVQVFNNGDTLFVELGPRGSGRPTELISVTSRGPVSVPEPGTLALLGLGLAGIGLARRRRKI